MRVLLILSVLLGIVSAEDFPELKTLVAEENFANPDYDCVILVNDEAKGDNGITEAIEAYQSIGQAPSSGTVVPFLSHPSKKLIVGITGTLKKNYADSRLIYDAASKATQTMRNLGLRRPLLVVGNFDTGLPKQPWAKDIWPQLTAILGMFHELYVPLQVRESRPSTYPRFDKFGVYKAKTDVIQYAYGIEAGRHVTRDLCASDQERTTPIKIEEYIKKHFTTTDVVSVKSEPIDAAHYPTMAAVDRVNEVATEYLGRVIKMEYFPPSPGPEVTETLYFIGKGVTYDTGGLSLKTNGGMRWMRKDKCGATAIAGFMKSLEILKPKGLKVYGRLGFVRNGVGAHAYAVDEIIASRAGIRSLMGSTDAEGRNVMVDLLAEAKEDAIKDAVPNPHLFTIATLTGHVGNSFGNVPAIVENGPARQKGFAKALHEKGALISEVSQISSLRREDYENCYSITEYEDLQQRNTHPNTVTYRGHQYPAAWMIMASKLDENGLDAPEDKQLPYTHLDVSSAVGVQRPDGTATGTPTAMLVSTYILPRLINPPSP